MNLEDYLKDMAAHDGSDLYLSAGAPPSAKFHGTLTPLEEKPLTTDEVKEFAYSTMSKEQITEFECTPEMNLAISLTGIGRFRVNIFRQRSTLSMVIRNIKTEIPNADHLGLPPILKEVLLSKNGLILFVGATGSGKSTSLAALIDYRNRNSAGHIITIEDPIEYLHPHKKSIISQREVGVDTNCYEDALKNALRQAPDVILIGEIRDLKTMKHALTFAETGHLCLSTLHANNANQALERIINFFPENRRPQLLLDLSSNLRAFISQRLIPTLNNRRTAAIEILLGTPLVRDLIQRGEIHAIKDVMEKSENVGMQTFDSALYKLYAADHITMEEALRNADSSNNLRLKINLSSKDATESKPSRPTLSLAEE